MNPKDFIQLTRGLNEPLCLLTAQGEFVVANPAACKVLGLQQQELPGKNLTEMVAAEENKKLSQALRNWSATRQPTPSTLKLCRDNGECVECHVQGSLFQPRTVDSPALILLRSIEKKNLTTQFVALNEKIVQLEKEILERRRVEKAYAKSEEQVRLLLDSSGEGLYGIDMEGNCTFANSACVQLLGYSGDAELLGKNMHRLIHHSYENGDPYPIETCKIFSAHINGREVAADDEVFWRKDGSAFPVEYSSHPVCRKGEVIGSAVTFTDISDRKAIETELEHSQETLERAQAIAHIGSWDWNIATGALYWSDEIYRIFGLEEQQFEATYEAFLKYIHPDDCEAVTEAVNQSVENENIHYDIEHRVVRPDGSERIVNERGKVYRNAKGEPIRMIGTVQDITEQKHTEIYMSMLFESSPIGLALCNMEGSLIDINPAYAKIIGRSIEETKSLTYWEVTPEDYAENEQQQLESLNNTGHYGPYEKEYIHKDGHRVPVRLLGQIIEFNGERLIWSSVEDITEAYQAKEALKRINAELEDRVEQRTTELKSANEHLQNSLQQLRETQDQLIQAEKMASLGGLVAGVAHEINTPVGVGVTAISHLQMKLADYAARYEKNELTRDDFEALLKSSDESSQIIRHNLERAADLIRSFKQVAVDQTSNELRVINLKDYLEEILHSLQPRLKRGEHKVSIQCPDELVLQTYPGALSQIITNLVMNSTIHAYDENQTGNILINIELAHKNGIVLSYKDDGKGLAKENVQKIFDPFFTTRRNLGGSGLGMHIVYNLVTQTLGGSIECVSKDGEGLEIIIEIPDCVDSMQDRPKKSNVR